MLAMLHFTFDRDFFSFVAIGKKHLSSILETIGNTLELLNTFIKKRLQ